MSLDVNLSELDVFDNVELHTYVEEFAKLRGINEFKYHADYICARTENLVANLFRVVINDVSGHKDYSISVIVKTLVNTERQEIFNKLHEREVLVYTVLFKKFNEIQQLVNEKDRIHLVECYLSNSIKGKEVLILEDLGIQGFELEPNLQYFQCMQFEHIYLAIIELAKFHSLSFVWKNRDPETYENLIVEFKDLVFSKNFLDKSKLEHYFQDSLAKAVKEVKNDRAKHVLTKIENKLLKIIRKLVKPGKYNVLCHGDFWTNNILYQHDHEGNPKEARFIDFQAMRFANPSTDIFHLIYLCTDGLFRRKYFSEIQEIYYKNLTQHLNVYGLNSKEIYPRHEFENDLKYYKPYGLLIALIDLKFVTKTTEADAIVKGSKLVGNDDIEEVPGEDILFIYRVNELVDDFVSDGSLDNIL